MMQASHSMVNSQGALAWQSWCAHLGRVLRNWRREPSSLIMMIIAPLGYLFIMVKLFGALSASMTGHFDHNAGVMLVVFSWAFILVITSTGQVFQERTNGFHERLAIMPASYIVVILARATGEFLRVLLMCLVVAAVSDLFSESTVVSDPHNLWRSLIVFVLISLASGIFGTYVGFSITSPQGSVIFMPLIMVSMFINTAMLPEQLYRPGLAAIARNTPVSAAASVVHGDSMLPLLLWCGGIFLLCLAGIVALARGRHKGVVDK